MEPESITLLSPSSYARRKRSGAPPRPPKSATTGRGKRRPLVESRPMARVYCSWTGKERAPWCDKTFHGSQLKRRKNAKAKKRRRATIKKLHNDTMAALSGQQQRGHGAVVPFCGDTRLLFKSAQGARDNVPLRIMVVFWAPGPVTAKRRSVTVENTSEYAMVHLLRRALKKKAGRPVLLDITYVIPWWNQGGAPGGHFASTAPKDLAYGMWRLGMHAVLTQPDAILSTSIDVARVLEHSSGLDPTAFLSEETKAAAAQLPILDMDPTTLAVTPRLAPIKRAVRVFSGDDDDAGAQVLQAPPPSSFGPRGTPHCRVPHPYLMSSDGVHRDVRTQHQFILFRVAEYLCLHVTPRARSPQGQGPDAAGSAPKRARVALQPAGDDAAAADASQPVLVLREQTVPLSSP